MIEWIKWIGRLMHVKYWTLLFITVVAVSLGTLFASIAVPEGPTLLSMGVLFVWLVSIVFFVGFMATKEVKFEYAVRTFKEWSTNLGVWWKSRPGAE